MLLAALVVIAVIIVAILALLSTAQGWRPSRVWTNAMGLQPMVSWPAGA